MKKTKIIFAFVLALALCLGGMATAAALEINDKDAVIGGTPTNPAEAAITKIFKLPEGTNVPTSAFKFDVTPKSWNDDETTGTKNKMPVVGTEGVVTINISASDNASTSTPPVTVVTKSNGIVSIAKESASLFAGKTWPGTGVFVYEIKEQQNNAYTVNPTPPPTEVMTYSKASYLLNVYVKQDSATGNYYVYALGAKRTTTDDGKPAENEKVDPTPGGNKDTYVYSQMTFTNTYVKILDKDPGGKTDVKNLSVKKAVTGDFANKDEYFNFKLTVTLPDIVTDATFQSVYKAYVLDAANTDVTAEANGAKPGEAFIDLTPGTALDFKLKHDQRLVVVGLPVGSTYDVEETNPTNYTPSAIITSGGTAGPNVPGTLSTNLKVENKIVADTAATTDGANRAAYTNDRDNVTPTGLNLNDIPFIGLIALALSAAAFFIVIKLRRRNNYSQANL